MKNSRSLYKNSFFLFFCIIFSVSAFSQTNYAIIPKLNTTGLTNEPLIRDIFTGNFADIRLDREDINFTILLTAYIYTYWDSCRTSLSGDKIQLSYQKCTTWVEHRTIGYFGTSVKSDCLESETEYIDVYASPAMYKAKTTVEALQMTDFFRIAIGLFNHEDPINAEKESIQQGLLLKQDIINLFGMNSCSSAGMKRFEQNLYAFAMNTMPVVLEGSQMHRQDPNVLLKNQDFEKLVDDLIYDQSASWIFNVYVQHSVTNLKVVSKDGQGRPSTITADYQFKSSNKEYAGSVTLTFIEGLPNCLYFFDFPATCRTASRKIVLNYGNGAYVSK